MTALRCLALLIVVVSLPYIAVIGGWIADQITAQTKLPTKGIDDEA